MTELLLTAEGLSRSFGGRAVVKGVSFQVPKGQSIGLLGPNGAGKTTIFRMLAGCLAPSDGRVVIAGSDMAKSPAEARRAIGYMPESAAVYGEMTAHEYLCFRAELSGRVRTRAEVRRAVQRAMDLANAQGAVHRPIGTLSKGFRQRVMLAAALLGDPPVLLLDEPTAGLDPNQVLEVRDLIRQLSQDRTIVISTHILSEVEAACTHALILNEGKLIASGALEDLKRTRTTPRLRLVYRGALPEELERVLRQASCFDSDTPGPEGTRTLVFFESEHISRSKALGYFLDSKLEVLEFGPIRAPLDEIFSHLTHLETGHHGERPES